MQIFKSRTLWTILIMFLINGFNGLTGYLPADVLMAINAILTGLAGYFKLSPSQSYGK